MEIRRCTSCHRVPHDGGAVRCPDCDAALELADERSLLGERLGAYRLVDVLGAGGMGVVFRAEHERLKRTAAVKVLQPQRDRDIDTRRFEREAQLVAGLQHPNIVAVYDYDHSASGLPYLVMELLDGRSLADLMRESYRGLPAASVAAVLADVVAGLDVAHAAGIVHRDLKPANVFVAREGNRVIAKLLDFGIAKSITTGHETSQLTASSAIVGTPLYLAPEQLRGDVVTPSTDQYALALMVCELLTGVAVRHGRTMSEIMTRDIAAPVPVAELAPNLPRPTARALERATEPDPKRRFPDLESFRRALGLPDESTGRADLATRLDAPNNRATLIANGKPGVLVEERDPLAPDTADTQPQVDGAPRRPGAYTMQAPARRPRRPLETQDAVSGSTDARVFAGSAAPLAVAAATRARQQRRRRQLRRIAAIGLVAACGAAAWWAVSRGGDDAGVAGSRASAKSPPAVARSWAVPGTALAVLDDNSERIVLAGPREWVVVPRSGGDPTRVPWPASDVVVGADTSHRLWIRRGDRLVSLHPVSQNLREQPGTWPNALVNADPAALTISPLGRYLAWDRGATVEVYRLDPAGAHLAFAVAASRQPPISLLVALTDRLLAVAEGDGAISLHDLASGRELWRQPVSHHQLRAVALTDDLPLVAVAGLFDGVMTWYLDSGAPGPELTGGGHLGALAWIPDQPTLLGCGRQGLVRWPLTASGSPRAPQTAEPVTGSPDSCRDVRVGYQGLLVLDSSQGELIELPTGPPLPVTYRKRVGEHEAWDLLVAAPDQGVYVGASDGTIHQLAPDGTVSSRRTHDAGVTALVARDADLASASDDHTLAVWRLPALDLRFRSTAHAYLINALAFAPDGLWSSSSDRLLKRWSWPNLEPREEIAIDSLLGEPVELHALWASPDGNELVAGTWGSRILALRRGPQPTVGGAAAKGAWQLTSRSIDSTAGYRFVALPGIEGLVMLGINPTAVYLIDRRGGSVDLDRVYQLPSFDRDLYGLAPAGDSALWLAGPGTLFRLDLTRESSGAIRWTARGWSDGTMTATATGARPDLLAVATNAGELLLLDPTKLTAPPFATGPAIGYDSVAKSHR